MTRLGANSKMSSDFSSLHRRDLLKGSVAAASSISLALGGREVRGAEVRVHTYAYKTVGSLQIKADVHRTDDETTRPVVVWLHGGALINGSRAGIDGRMKSLLLGAGYAIVSFDYRLAPETKLPGIIEDVEDAFAWLRDQGGKLQRLDTRKIAVIGGSAGGYLTLTTGFRIKPPPTVLVSFWGYGDLVGDWYSTPSSHPRHQQIRLSREEAFQQVSGPPVADARDRKGNGGAFYQYCRQHGIWPKEVGGWDPQAERERFIPYMPVHNVTAEFPPTLLIHGTKDTDVPYEQSLMMADQLRKHQVPHQLITVPGAEHGLAGGEPEIIDKAYLQAMDFVNLHMR